MPAFLKETLAAVGGTLVHNAPYLVLGILIAAAVKVYVDPEKLKKLLLRHASASIPGAVAFGALTPFCACGSMAIVISMLTTTLPWGPIMAFLTSSPLMSPDGFVMIAGIVSTGFATALAAASIIIGLGSGWITHFIEKRTRFLEGQARFSGVPAQAAGSRAVPVAAPVHLTAAGASCCATSAPDLSPAVAAPCGCGPSPVAAQVPFTGLRRVNPELRRDLKLQELRKVIVEIGFRQVLPYFALFAAIGYMINRFVPAEFIVRFLGKGNVFAVPVLAVAGLPLYVTGASAIPVINSLLAGGASGGALLAFLITGPGTSAGVIAGLATIMKRRAIALYVAFLLVFAVALGYLYDLIVAAAG